MASIPDKRAVLAALEASLREEIEAIERVAEATRAEVGSDETRQEGMYDTRAIEASYLARGQAQRIAQLRQQLAWLERFDPDQPLEPPVVQVGALVVLGGHRRELVFVAPVGGGRLRLGDHSVRLISPSGPMGEELMELEVGDDFDVDSPRGLLSYEVLEIV
jgi:transcription elongation GreA/GreB family factor